jgi:hypothetical protein
MSSFSLKILAIITMLIDHVGLVFFPSNLIWRIIGRLSFPIFAFQLGIGYSHTKNKIKHIFTLLIFAVVSQVPFMIFTSIYNYYELNIGFTLLLGLLCIYALDNINNKYLSIITITIILLISNYLPIDYGPYGVVTIVFFYLFENNKLTMSITQIPINIYYWIINKNFLQPLSLFALIPINLYNNKKGRSCKWLFYIFYPTHLLILYFIKININSLLNIIK